MTKVKLYRRDGLWRWRIRDSNGVIIGASSEAYRKRSMALRNLNRITRLMGRQSFALPKKTRLHEFDWNLPQ